MKAVDYLQNEFKMSNSKRSKITKDSKAILLNTPMIVKTLDINKNLLKPHEMISISWSGASYLVRFLHLIILLKL